MPLFNVQCGGVIIQVNMTQHSLTQHSAWRLSLARRIAPAYTANSKVEAAFVFGSVASGFADQYSDTELAFVWSQPPSAEELQAAAQKAGASDWEIGPYEEARQSWSEQFYVEGMKVETGHWTRETIDVIVADVVERYDVSQNWLVFEKQATASALQRAVILYGEGIIKHWQERLSPYPEELAVAMVQKHLKFNPFAGQEALAERAEIPLLYENHCVIIRRLLSLLFGLNRLYHPGFKWTRCRVEEMSIKPSECFTRLERVFQSDGLSGTQELRQLIEETFDLVEKHLPQIDLTQQRETFNRPYPKWELPDEIPPG
jgi:predicted nucleotidyltransferase